MAAKKNVRTRIKRSERKNIAVGAAHIKSTFNNDKVGLIVFAGDAFTQLPITSDYVSAKMFLETIQRVQRQKEA